MSPRIRAVQGVRRAPSLDSVRSPCRLAAILTCVAYPAGLPWQGTTPSPLSLALPGVVHDGWGSKVRREMLQGHRLRAKKRTTLQNLLYRQVLRFQ